MRKSKRKNMAVAMGRSVVVVTFIATTGIALAQQPSIFSVGQQIEIKTGPGWRPCTVKDAGGPTRLARADCPAVTLGPYNYGALEENFQAHGSADVRMPGSCETTSPYPNSRRVAGCSAPAAGTPPAPVTKGQGRPDTALTAKAERLPAQSGTATPVPQADPNAPKLERCVVGMRVLTPGGLPATVVAAQGAGCTIQTDAGNKQIDGTFSAFMLRPIGPAPKGTTTAQGVGVLPLGEYGCIGAGTTQLAGLGSKLLAGGRYTDLDGKSPGKYVVEGNKVRFIGGHLDGQVGEDIKNNGYRIGRVSCQKW